MIYRRLGRTQLRLSVLGLGAGGPHFLGQQSGVPQQDVNAFVRRALDLGVNYFDVSPSFVASHADAEPILGRALEGLPRERFVISGKAPLIHPVTGAALSGAEVVASLERTLQRLKLECLDVFYVGGYLPSGAYEPLVAEVFPALQRARQQGKVRFIGGGEKSSHDGSHQWLAYGLERHLFDAVMVAYNLVNQSADRTVFPLCQRHDVGVVTIYSVRHVFNDPARLAAVMRALAQAGEIDPNIVSVEDPLGRLIADARETPIGAAYKWAAGHPAVTTVMTGTLNAAHLAENARLIEGPYLAPAHTERLRRMFGRVTSVVGN